MGLGFAGTNEEKRHRRHNHHDPGIPIATRRGEIASIRPGPGSWLLLLLTALVASLALAPVASARPVPIRSTTAPVASHDWSPPRTVYIPETGHTIDGLFLDLWRGGGGYWSFGNPITPEFTVENGHVIQYYEYARFEYWPEGAPNGNYAVLGNIGEELRPYAVPRRTAAQPISAKETTTSNRSAEKPAAVTTSAAVELALMAKAWVPLPADQIGTDTDTYRYVAATGHSVQHGFKTFWETTGEAAFLGNPLTEEYVQGGVTYQVFERGQLAWTDGVDPYMVPVGELLAERYELSRDPVPQGDIPTYSEDLFVAPEHPSLPALDPNAERWMEVNLSSQYMIAWQGDVAVIESYVSTGKYGFETPPGTFYVNNKLYSQDMEGVLGGEYYNVPGVPYVMYFTDRGHAIHGAYWHNNFGAPMSHGCINLPLDVAAFIYDWAPMGMRVEIHW